MKTKLFLFLLLTQFILNAQEYFPKNTGVKSTNSNFMAFTNAKIMVSPTLVIEKGTLLIRNGKVTDVGSLVKIPSNTTVVNLDGKCIYPSFIDVYSDFGVEKPNRVQGGGRTAQYDSNRKGFYWNEHIMPENKAVERFRYDQKKAKELQKAGFGLVNTHIQDGIIRGTGVLVALNSEGNNANRIIEANSAQYLSFSKSVTSQQSYPTSLMGAMALLRQLYVDAAWYANGNINTKDLSIEALNRNKKLQQIFYAGNKLNVLRADKVGDQFGIQYTIVGKGDEYQLVNEIKETNATLILPLNFPKAYDVENPFQADYLSLSDMRYWNQAPANPAILAENNIEIAFTTHGLKSLPAFRNNILKSIEYGLNKTKALEALTTVPAKILGRENEIGELKKGMQANFLITSGDIFDKKTTLYENWVRGVKHIINDLNISDLNGLYNLSISEKNYEMTISGSLTKSKIIIKSDSTKISSSIRYKEHWIGIILNEENNIIKLKGTVAAEAEGLNGTAILADGTTANWSAVKKEEKSISKKKSVAKKEPEIVPVTYPNNGYGLSEKPEQEDILFKNVTVWTNEKEGILDNSDVLIKNGKIAKIGENLSAGSAKIIDGTGKHLTTGIIDEHTHVAATSSNEAGHNSTAEVRMEDTIDSEDINIYRNLAGGVTTMQILHGSANPIGGQSAIVKLKWGKIGRDMVYTNTPKFIKFALGENVKQSNWESYSRFPQTRMGVEQVFVDYFQRAKEYDAVKKSGKPYRKDFELDALAEILNKERFITCHSYVQSEINMLMKVAERFNFRVNTFTHILEGYKVADKMKNHGVGGSTFSDWWTYKYEVKDAIPYNASIMHKAGVLTAINSDDREMSRRLNQEAAKAVKYGDISEEEAWKFVTLNPAKLLHIDDRVGSIKVGKDADLVLWDKHPLSVYAKAEKTLIEGAVYFDIEKDLQSRKNIKKERNKLINMMLQGKIKGAPTQKVQKKVKEELHCDTVEKY